MGTGSNRGERSRTGLGTKSDKARKGVEWEKRGWTERSDGEVGREIGREIGLRGSDRKVELGGSDWGVRTEEVGPEVEVGPSMFKRK